MAHWRLKNTEVQNQMKETRQRINDMLQYEVELKARYLKQNYYESGPKAAKLLARRLRKQKVDTMVTELYDNKLNAITNKPNEIENIFKQYHQELYNQTATINQREMDNFLDNLELPSIGTIQNENITKSITIEEIQKSIKHLKNNKAPGSDGFPAEWYKVFEKELSPLLLRTFNYVIGTGNTPPSWREAIISVLPKPEKDRKHCQNHRPISMLNVDYKIFTSIISNRLKSFIQDIIDEDQTSFFVPGRQTQDNIRRTLHIIDKVNTNKIPSALISLDAEKAFDRVNWEYLYKALKKFGFNEKAVQIISALYNKPTARIKVNGSLSDSTNIERGTRQGCCLSPTLFALYIEPLAQMIGQNEMINGIEINGQQHIISLFADDVLIYLNDPVNSFSPLMRMLEEFGIYSGYKINISKTQILMLNCSPSQKLKQIQLNWEMKTIRYLGINIPKNLMKL